MIHKRQIDLRELEGDDYEEGGYIVNWPPREELFWYLAPVLTCACGNWIELPYSNLAQTDEAGVRLLRGEDPPERPPEEWTVTFVCRQCGRAEEYLDWDVQAKPIPKLSEGIYQSGKGVFRVRFPCGEKRCPVPVEVYVDIGDGSASEAIALLRSAACYWDLPCEHEIKTVPATLYSAEPVLRRMW